MVTFITILSLSTTVPASRHLLFVSKVQSGMSISQTSHLSNRRVSEPSLSLLLSPVFYARTLILDPNLFSLRLQLRYPCILGYCSSIAPSLLSPKSPRFPLVFCLKFGLKSFRQKEHSVEGHYRNPTSRHTNGWDRVGGTVVDAETQRTGRSRPRWTHPTPTASLP